MRNKDISLGFPEEVVVIRDSKIYPQSDERYEAYESDSGCTEMTPTP